MFRNRDRYGNNSRRVKNKIMKKWKKNLEIVMKFAMLADAFMTITVPPKGLDPEDIQFLEEYKRNRLQKELDVKEQENQAAKVK